MKREMMNTMNWSVQNVSGRARSSMSPLAILVMWVMAGAYPCLAQPTQQTFPSASDASQNLFQAVQHNDVQVIANILGGATDLTSCGDEAQDKAERELFVQKFQEMHRLGREADGSVTLYIGAENWPFPIPLVEKNGVWHFDPDTGKKEILFRRIGENELAAIVICHEFVAAEKEYQAEPNSSNPASSFPTTLLAQAAGESARHDPVLIYGYYFQVLATRPTNGARPAELKTKRDFALIAYPAEYRSSGVMTFIVTDNNVVYEKDLGANTSALTSAITTFHKDATWHAANE